MRTLIFFMLSLLGTNTVLAADANGNGPCAPITPYTIWMAQSRPSSTCQSISRTPAQKSKALANSAANSRFDVEKRTPSDIGPGFSTAAC